MPTTKRSGADKDWPHPRRPKCVVGEAQPGPAMLVLYKPVGRWVSSNPTVWSVSSNQAPIIAEKRRREWQGDPLTGIDWEVETRVEFFGWSDNAMIVVDGAFSSHAITPQSLLTGSYYENLPCRVTLPGRNEGAIAANHLLAIGKYKFAMRL